MGKPTALIIGAGPAGLTAAHELLRRTDVRPIVLEMSDSMGGLSRTVNYKGNRIDIGGHRFFSKSDRVMRWWRQRMPIEAPGGPDPDLVDSVMLLRLRRSRIFYGRKLFDYPISLNVDTLRKLGLWRVMKIGTSYARAMVRPIRDAKTLEEFFINRFGRELYETFFKSYTEKVWSIPCSQISAEWGAQRIKGLSITKAVLHALKRPFAGRDVAQKGTETSLIEQFLYPKLGPGQMWEHVADEVRQMGGDILTGQQVRRIDVAGRRVAGVEAVDVRTGKSRVFSADYCFSTMPVKQLVRSLSADPPRSVRQVAEGLLYRDFLTVGLLLERLKIHEHSGRGLIRDNWIYIQEPDVRVGRLQIFNNWSPYLVADPQKVWVGMEYFCNEHDDLWIQRDEQLKALAIGELAALGIIDPADVLDGTVIRMPKTYPAYFGTYDRFEQLQAWLDQFENLFLIGRNGMHRYNNMDHSMLTAMTAVDNILQDRIDKANIWAVNTEREYHEDRQPQEAQEKTPIARPEEPSTPKGELVAPRCERRVPMKVVLVRPNYDSHIITPPLGLGYLASYVKQHGIDGKIIDGLRDNLPEDTLIDRIASERPDLVGITCLTAFYNQVVRLSRRLKDRGMRVVIGGVHPTFLPYETLEDSGADYVVRGEGETALLELLQSDFAHEAIPGIYTLDDARMGKLPDERAAWCTDLDALPFPDWQQIDPRTYPKAPHGAIVKRFPIGVVTSTRGCPQACTFCASPKFYERKLRFRSPENVVDEVQLLVERFGVREIHFEDDNLTSKRSHVEAICRLILQRGIKVSWACPNGIRADRVDEELIRLMKRAGCYYFAYGIESANPQILRNVKKRETIDTIRRAIDVAAKVGISCQGFFVFGLPGETPETMEETIQFAVRSRLSRAQFLILDVIPGSELWNTLSGRFDPNWSKKSYKEPEWIPEGLTREALKAAQSRAFRKFYSRPGRFLRLAASIKPSQLKYLLHRLADYRILGSSGRAKDVAVATAPPATAAGSLAAEAAQPPVAARTEGPGDEHEKKGTGAYTG